MVAKGDGRSGTVVISLSLPQTDTRAATARRQHGQYRQAGWTDGGRCRRRRPGCGLNGNVRTPVGVLAPGKNYGRRGRAEWVSYVDATLALTHACRLALGVQP